MSEKAVTAMETKLSPKSATTYYSSDGGSYNVWLSTDMPILSEAKIGGGELVLEPFGLALPHYADSSKIGYVVEESLMSEKAVTAMETKLSPKSATTYYSSDGGSYNVWLSTDMPILSEAKIGGGELVLEPFGLALPHYADSSKIGYVVEGTAVVGIVSPDGQKERVVRLKQGDAIPVFLGTVSWWYNDNTKSKVVILFFGETQNAYIPGLFSYFFLIGTNTVFGGFSLELLSRNWSLDEEKVSQLLKSQTGQIIVKLEEATNMPKPQDVDTKQVVFNMNALPLDVEESENGVRIKSLTSAKAPLLGELGLSAKLVKLVANATFSLGYLVDAAAQLIYIVRGSGQVEITGLNGTSAMKAKLEAGFLFVVPKLFVVSQIAADGEGMEWFSVITTPQPVFSQFAGKTSMFKALSPLLLEAAFNVSPELVKKLRSGGSSV